MLDIDYMRGCGMHYRHLARGTEDRKLAETLRTIARIFDAEADLTEEQLYALRRAPRDG